MKYLATALVLSLLFVLSACGSNLTTYKARIAVLTWSKQVEASGPGTGTAQLSSEEVSNNSGPIVIKGIQELPQENAAKADLEFNNFKFSGSSRPYSGIGVATFSHYSDGTWVLKKVSISGKEWDNLDIKAE